MGKTGEGEGAAEQPPGEETQVYLTEAERKAAARRAERLRKRRLVRIGQVFLVLAVLVGGTHALMHLQVFGSQPSGIVDLLAGYPMAAVLGIIGAMLAGQ